MCWDIFLLYLAWRWRLFPPSFGCCGKGISPSYWWALLPYRSDGTCHLCIRRRRWVGNWKFPSQCPLELTNRPTSFRRKKTRSENELMTFCPRVFKRGHSLCGCPSGCYFYLSNTPPCIPAMLRYDLRRRVPSGASMTTHTLRDRRHPELPRDPSGTNHEVFHISAQGAKRPAWPGGRQQLHCKKYLSFETNHLLFLF